MSYKFNRGCWVKSCTDLWTVTEAPDTPREGEQSRASGSMPTVEERIALAQKVYAEHGHRLMSNVLIRNRLRRLREGISVSRDTMHHLDIPRLCARCDAEMPEGSCCGTGLEHKIDVATLLINLLMGLQIPQSRLRRGSCFFLGETGCVLAARHMICIDYLCPAVEAFLGPERLIQMQEATGLEIENLFLLTELINGHMLQILGNDSQ